MNWLKSIWDFIAGLFGKKPKPKPEPDNGGGTTNEPPVVTPPVEPPATGSGVTFGQPEVCGQQAGTRIAACVDAQGNLYAVTDWDTKNTLRLYVRKLAAAWTETLLAQGEKGGKYDASRIFVPSCAVVGDRLVVSSWFGIKEWGKMGGPGVWSMPLADPSPATAIFKMFSSLGPRNAIVCAEKTQDTAILYSKEGSWDRINSALLQVYGGRWGVTGAGEKFWFLVSETGIWHAVSSGFSGAPSRYRNSRMSEQQPWALHSRYPEMSNDTTHPGCGYDGKDEQVGYVACQYNPGLVCNVWAGGKFLFPANNLPVLDAHARILERTAVSIVPCPTGGAYWTWPTAGGGIMFCHMSATGAVSDRRQVASGTCSWMIRQGNTLHLFYMSGVLKYVRGTVG